MVSRARALPGARTSDDVTDPAKTPELLLRRVARGDEQAFAELYDIVAGSVLGIVTGVLRDHAQSEVVAQEALLEIWLEAAQFDEHCRSALAWVLTIAHRRAVDRVRYQHATIERENLAGQLELSTAERVSLEQHPTDCAACRGEVDELSEVAVQLAVAVPPLPAAGMKDRVLDDIRARPQRRLDDALGQTQLLPALDALGRTDIMPALNGLSDNHFPPTRRGWIIRVSAGVAAAVAVVAVLITGLTLVGGEHSGTVVAADQVRDARDAVTRSGVLTTAEGAATAVFSASAGKVIVTVTGLPAPDNDHGYQLWTIPADGTPRSAGMMRVSGDRTELTAGLPQDTALLAITAEPSNGSVQPTTPIVARIPLN
ncbi:anti-sigma factor domain-containing protein [Nocardia sp. NPDC051321]|uniref:anti-sigma factor n=1 Tax=Nocardia sp. NPDC051321 TaxID=3364323 RepID=UPI0037B002EE